MISHKAKVYLEPCQISIVQLFYKNNEGFLTVNYFLKKLRQIYFAGS